ncbi:Helicase [Gracilaria domingensis]|nr:Helicase [Gracilaria domingensis]
MAFVNVVFRSAPRSCTHPLFAPRENTPPKQPLSPQQRRLAAKQAERLPRPSNDSEDRRRRQLAAETLSADDIAGILDTSPSSDEIPLHDLLPSVKPPEALTSPTSLSTPMEIALPDVRSESPEKQLKSSSPPKKPFPLNPGCLVIHLHHGIGRFIGLERTSSSEGAMQEYAVVSYRDGELYVPLSQLELLTPLSPEDAAQVRRLDHMQHDPMLARRRIRSSKSRYLARKRTRANIRRQLVNLHSLYSSRHLITRNPFPVDESAERTFSQKCPFRLTKDQTLAVEQVLHDMSSRSTPMDRLLCGDVGFGKTEVAIRAAFRAILAGKQVAVLSPTTILAHQHHETFKERLSENYPEFAISCMTRFVPRRKVLEARKAIRDGTCHIVVGSHMLLGDAVSFSNLGLLIVDEEHRFGVNQKEKIRARHQNIDILSLSATPIPRTLHLALTGLRDTSILREPPEGRKPIATSVCPRGVGPIRRAISDEMRRGGQVFFVVPRVDGIDSTAEWLRQLFPNLRVLVAHGQMSDVEHRVWEFASGKYDVLVCTTIIENGINMPDVNTIVVNDATRFGLAQLHQLRGRVGRSDRQAFAWFLYNESLGPKASGAIERLKTLEKYKELGSGFKIAQKDMEMRGVGTVLGVEQHGNNSLEAAEYAQMLAEELEHVRTGDPIPLTLPTSEAVEVFLPVSSLIPEEFIPDLEQKMAVYSAFSAAKSRKQLISVAKRLQKQYGALPPPTIRHVSVLELKIFARDVGIRRIASERQHVILDWAVDEVVFKTLKAFVTDETTRTRLEHVVLEERVLVRGLGICSGDVQLAKLRALLKVFSEAAKGWPRRGSPVGSSSRRNSLIEKVYGT